MLSKKRSHDAARPWVVRIFAPENVGRAHPRSGLPFSTTASPYPAIAPRDSSPAARAPRTMKTLLPQKASAWNDAWLTSTKPTHDCLSEEARRLRLPCSISPSPHGTEAARGLILSLIGSTGAGPDYGLTRRVLCCDIRNSKKTPLRETHFTN